MSFFFITFCLYTQYIFTFGIFVLINILFIKLLAYKHIHIIYVKVWDQKVSSLD